MKKTIALFFAFSLTALLGLQMSAQGSPIRPLANDFIIIGESPDPMGIPLYTPSILRLDSGRLVAAYEYGGRTIKPPTPKTFILTSDNHGKTWKQRAGTIVSHGRLFQAGKSIYYLGHHKDLRILRSDDDGGTWSDVVTLTEGEEWHQSACNVWRARGNIYLVMERRVTRAINAWYIGEMAPVLMRAREDADLTKRENWTFASELVFQDLIPGYRENNPRLDYFGVPFFKQNYPEFEDIAEKRRMSPIGWLETNVVQITDPAHYWFDPSGKTFHLFMRAHTGGTGYAALAKVVENDDGTMSTMLEKVPSGKTALFLPFPGGQMRFHVLYDKKTKLYWMLGSQATDSMTKAELLPKERFDLPNNERHRMVLHFSKNMVDWCFAGLVAITGSPKEARHYACMDFDGDDLVIVSRSGDYQAKSAHNGNIITFHRVKNFRNLVY